MDFVEIAMRKRRRDYTPILGKIPAAVRPGRKMRNFICDLIGISGFPLPLGYRTDCDGAECPTALPTLCNGRPQSATMDGYKSIAKAAVLPIDSFPGNDRGRALESFDKNAKIAVATDTRHSAVYTVQSSFRFGW